ncbi:uncharacterized protein DSM5745_03053 [Aspergillus mulundensis]|uniref:Uncharacterized protein n=1 Tax=Aspergillus mulundensis TaxID=1810919 RepID=A0A3D8SJR2_9EURO|nr:hypothetical protein DSM5745_03053 [Aspergillus mulundensis]RDW86411.1 hypothetical protein DSM5745_03053 [Aspergillus mulundensis]
MRLSEELRLISRHVPGLDVLTGVRGSRHAPLPEDKHIRRGAVDLRLRLNIPQQALRCIEVDYPSTVRQLKIMTTSATLSAVSALLIGNAVAQITITIPPLPDRPSVPMPTIPSTISLPSLPSLPILTSFPRSACVPLPPIPTATVIPTLVATASTASSDSDTEPLLNDQFERTHPRQMVLVDL